MDRSLAIVGLLALCACCYAEDTIVVVEAESFRLLVPRMLQIRDHTASGNACVQALTYAAVGRRSDLLRDGGHVAYRVKIPQEGDYRLWGRCLWSDGCGNSLFLRVADQPVTVLGQNGTYAVWHWVKGPTVHLTAGWHRITFRCREEKGKLDQFMLTDNLRYVPIRAMAETPQYVQRH